jgi:RNA polymerase sigma-70 factor (ECF subfamily)
MPDAAHRERSGRISPLAVLDEAFGGVPSVFAAQEALPRMLEAEAALVGAVLADGALPRARKEEILLAAASSRGSLYWAQVHARALLARGRTQDELAAVARSAPVVAGAAGAETLEAVQAAGLSALLCALADALGVSADTDAPDWLRDAVQSRLQSPMRAAGGSPPSVPAAEPPSPGDYAPFRALQAALGFVPRVFRAQTDSPRVLEAEIEAAMTLLFGGEALTPVRRELVLLAAAASRLDPYSCALHAERLKGMGVPEETVEEIVAGRGTGTLSEDDAALVRRTERPRDGRPAASERPDAATLESTAAAAFGAFLGAVAAELGLRPDFRAPRASLEERRARHEAAPEPEDPDAPLVGAARAGDASAFEELLRRHQARVYRTLAGLTGDAGDAEDGCQVVFLRAFRGLAEFAGASRFSTWLTRIAIREGIDRVRRRHPTESLDDVASDEDFRPALVDPWVEDPERLYAREEMRRLVRQELGRLPVRYRAAVMLRDIEQLSTAEAAAALELPVATLKTRLLRGRLLLREALSAHFSQEAEDGRV